MRAVVFGASGAIGGALALVLAERGAKVLAGARNGGVPQHDGITPFAFDLEDGEDLQRMAVEWRAAPPELVLVATGVLSLPDGTGPERSLKSLDAATMAQVLAINTIGPALIARAILPILPRDRRTVFAALSARVGSIGDNRLGGWHSYRASKAALNMLLRNFALEMARTHPHCVVAGLHPGTVESALSARYARGDIHSPEQAAGHLLRVIEALRPVDSGHVFDWKGERLPD